MMIRRASPMSVCSYDENETSLLAKIRSISGGANDTVEELSSRIKLTPLPSSSNFSHVYEISASSRIFAMRSILFTIIPLPVRVVINKFTTLSADMVK